MINPFSQKENFCKNDCQNCNYCENFAKRVIDSKKTVEIYKSASEFYSQYDQFKRTLNAINQTKTNEQNLNLNADFEID